MSLTKNLDAWLKTHLPSDTKRIAVAVSGGADSLCLAHLLCDWCQKNAVQLFAFTVDHGLRSESAKEARSVHTLLTKWKVRHQTLLWRGVKPKTRVEEKAREARYDLMYQACQKNKIQCLFLAHHLEDQAETFWTRLAHGSGVDGLSAMEPVLPWHQCFLMRPLLRETKADIVAYLKTRHIAWFEDKMNQDTIYERVRWRQRQKTLSDWGLTPEMIATLTNRIQSVKYALSFYTENFIKNNVFLSPVGYAFIQKLAWDVIPPAIQIRVLQKILPILTGDERLVSLEGLENLLVDKRASFTFAGCQFVKNNKGLYITKEHRILAKNKIIQSGKWMRWDRFDILTFQKKTISILPKEKYFKNLPALIQKSFPYTTGKIHYSIDSSCFFGIYVAGMPVMTQKELEKKARLDYKKGEQIIYIHFNPGKNNA